MIFLYGCMALENRELKNGQIYQNYIFMCVLCTLIVRIKRTINSKEGKNNLHISIFPNEN